jgi:hypothetical protein
MSRAEAAGRHGLCVGDGSMEGQLSAVVDTSAACCADGLEPVGDDLESPAVRAVLDFPGVRIWSRPSM